MSEALVAEIGPAMNPNAPWEDRTDYAEVRVAAVDPMSLSLFSLGSGADLSPGQCWVGESYGGRGFVAGAVLAGFPDGVVVVAGSLDGAGVGPLAAGVEVPRARDLGDDVFDGLFPLVRGERPPGRRPGGG